MTPTREQIEEIVPDILLEDDEIDEQIDQIVEGNPTIPIDASLQVTVEIVPGDSFDETHAHLLPEGIVYHLVPEDAKTFDVKLNEFTLEVEGLGGDEA